MSRSIIPRPSLAARFLGDHEGSVALEFCLVAPMLLTFMLAIYDFGFLIYDQSQVITAANAGALYAYKLGIAGFSSSAISSATTGASYPITISATPAPYKACGCPNVGDTSLTTATCGSTCSDGTAAGTYAVVTAQATPQPILSWPGMPAQVTAAVVMRLQ